MIWSKHLRETVAFYTEKLGFTCDEISEEWGWASLSKDHVGLMVALPNDQLPFDEPAFTGSIYISTDEVDELWEKLKDEVSLVYGLENFEYGMREFAIYDNNGYMIQFGQSIEVGAPTAP